MKRKYITLSALLLLIISPLFSISFGYHTFEVRTSPEFSKGVLPTSLLYQFDFPVPDIIKGNNTEINFRIDNGIDFRTIRQFPETGIPFASNPGNSEWEFPKDYISIFNEMNLVFGQGFIKTEISNSDLLKFWLSFDIRFENAYERFSYLKDPSYIEGLFFIKPSPNKKERFSNWIGQPELQGDRSSSNISFSLGFNVDFMQDKITRRNGIKNSFYARLNPSWTDWFKDGTHDFLFFEDQLDLAVTLFHLDQKGKRDTTWLSMILDNNTTYRCLIGNKIPYYIQGGKIFGSQALNTEHVITNRTSLTIYGPQINSYDCYPYISGFVDIGISLGNLLNTTQTISYSEFIGSAGVKIEFMIFNIASIYYEYGYIFNNVLNEKNSTISKFGFSFGV